MLPSAAKKVQELLAAADVQVNGHRPWDIQVRDERFYQRALAAGSLGVGESYMDGWWEVEALDEFFARIAAADLERKLASFPFAWLTLKARIFNRQTRSRSTRVARRHYDLGNELFQIMLDRNMQYTCAYWKDARTLDEAQEAKLQLIARKLHLRPGMKVLDLGGGFGGLARWLAKECGCEVVSYNISAEQVGFGREFCKGLPVRFEQKDYREAVHEQAPFDRVAAIGLCEHIGYKNYRSFLELVHQSLKDEGLFILHTVGSNRSRTSSSSFFDKYIFPNGMVPSIAQLGRAMESLWVMEDWHNFGPDYEKTVLAWWERFDRGWETLRPRYGDRFYRMWKFYLMACAGAFRSRSQQLWQLVLSKGDIPFYTPVR